MRAAHAMGKTLLLFLLLTVLNDVVESVALKQGAFDCRFASTDCASLQAGRPLLHGFNGYKSRIEKMKARGS